LGVGIAEIGGLGIGIGGLAQILCDPEASLIDLAEKRIGFLRPLLGLCFGELERGQILALGIGGVSGAFGGVGGRPCECEHQRGE